MANAGKVTADLKRIIDNDSIHQKLTQALNAFSEKEGADFKYRDLYTWASCESKEKCIAYFEEIGVGSLCANIIRAAVLGYFAPEYAAGNWSSDPTTACDPTPGIASPPSSKATSETAGSCDG